MTFGFFILLGALAGAGVAWWLGRARQQQLRAEIAGEIQRTLPQVAEAVLAPKAQQLERAAGQELKLLGADTVHQVRTGQAGLQATMEAMQQRLEAYQTRLNELEKSRAGEQANLQAQLAQVASAGAAMAQEARTLRSALATNNGVRGNWGEQVLANILNACGLNENVDFELQVAADSRLRPDAVIRLPSGRRLAVDAKASLAAFLEGLDAADEAARRERFVRFAQVLRARARELAGKEYSRYLADSLPCVVMFVPSEGAFRAALDADPELYRFGQQLQPSVLLASPSTLFPMLSVIAHGWQQHQASHEMGQLMAEVRELGARLQAFLGHVQSVGKGLDAAGKAYNAALGSYRSRLGPSLTRVQALGAGWTEPEELKPVENQPQLPESVSSQA